MRLKDEVEFAGPNTFGEAGHEEHHADQVQCAHKYKILHLALSKGILQPVLRLE